MSASLQLIEWFRADPLPAILPEPLVVIGGTALLEEFLTVPAGSPDGGELLLTTPFVGCTLLKDLPVWDMLPHRCIDLSVVTASAVHAQHFVVELGALPWRSFAVGIHPRLHAKLYTFVTPQNHAACLIGSHNLTQGGARVNAEAGVLLRSRGDSQVTRIIHSCRGQIMQLMREAETVTDTLHWPPERAAVTLRR